MGKGVMWGLLFGFFCVLIPLLLFFSSWRLRNRRHLHFASVGALVLGVIFAIPNLLTLTVVLGGNNAAHAGERILDVDGPGFRGASTVGAVVGVIAFLGLLALRYAYRKRGEELSRVRGDLNQREPRSSGEAPAPEM